MTQQSQKTRKAIAPYGAVSFFPKGTPAVAEDEDNREERARGGKINTRDYPAKRLTRLQKAAKWAHDSIALETKPIMDMPDEQVVNALRIAKDK